MIISSRQIYTFPITPTRTSGNFYWGVTRGSGTKLFTVYNLQVYMTTAGSGATAALGLSVDNVAFSPNITITTGNSTGLKVTSGLTFPISLAGSFFQVQQVTASDTTGIGTVLIDLDISY